MYMHRFLLIFSSISLVILFPISDRALTGNVPSQNRTPDQIVKVADGYEGIPLFYPLKKRGLKESKIYNN